MDEAGPGVAGHTDTIKQNEVMSQRPVLIYDGDCAFCTKCVAVVERMHVDADLLAWQFADLPALGLSVAAVSDAVQWIGTDGSVHAGHDAVAGLLIYKGGLWVIAGRFLRLPGISWLAARAYRLVANNRHRLPGGTAACALPPEQRPGWRAS